jgi:glycine/D-amino acid oxidase-like deaminating enzyme
VSAQGARSTPTPPEHKRHGKKHKRRAATSPALAPASPAGAVVELVPSTPPSRVPGHGMYLSRRDFLMLGTGAGGVLFAMFVGWLLAQFLRRKEPSSPPSDKPDTPKED